MNFHFTKRIALPAITACLIAGPSGLAYAGQIKAPPRPPASDRILAEPGAAPESFHKHKHRHKKEKRDSKGDGKSDDKPGKGKG